MTLEDNPLLIKKGIPRFNLIKPEHIEPAVSKILEKSEKKLQESEDNLVPTWEGLIRPLEDLSIPFDYGWAPISHLLNVKNSKDLREEHQKMLPKVVQFILRLGQSKPVFNGYLAIKEGIEWEKLDDAQKRVVKLKIRDAELAGVGLEGEEKHRFNEIATELSKLGNDFMNNVLDATNAYELIITDEENTRNWPQSLLQLSSQSYNTSKNTDESTPGKGPWRITLEAPLIQPFMKHSRVKEQREALYRAYLSIADSGDWDNTPLILRILKLRKEQSDILGYENFADLSLVSKMAPSVASVFKMLNELFDASKPHQLREFDSLVKIAIAEGQVESLDHWDLTFWSERLKEKKFNLTDDQVRPYFPLSKVLEGMFELTDYLFNVKIVESKEDIPKWHKDVRYFKVFEDNEQIGSFYLDAYSRPSEKRGGAWMDNGLDRRIINSVLRLPVIYLNANGTPPIGERPSLLSFDEVTTLFHEFGHGLQGMLTKVDYPDVSGINGVEWDAVEICSQFLENWCYHEPTMKSISSHWETGQSLPEEYIVKIKESKVFMAANSMIRQLEFGLTDLELHSGYDPDSDLSPFDVHKKISERTKVLPPLEYDHTLCAFSHIFSGGYAAGYYSYKWAEALSADLFSKFEEIGIKNENEIKKLGKKFRDSFLALGGSVEPMQIFIEFMGREPSTEALLRLNNLL